MQVIVMLAVGMTTYHIPVLQKSKDTGNSVLLPGVHAAQVELGIFGSVRQDRRGSGGC